MPPDYVRRFLAATTRIYVVQRNEVSCSMVDFKKAFKQYMRLEHPNIKCTPDEPSHAPFTELGYRVVDANWCKACGKEAAGGAQRCCPAYCNANRTHHTRILGMEIVRERAEGDIIG